VGNTELRGLSDEYLQRYPIRAADVAAGEHMALLYHRAAIPNTRLQLPLAAYVLVSRYEKNAAHLLIWQRPALPTLGAEDDKGYAAHNAWRPQWRLGYGPLQLGWV